MMQSAEKTELFETMPIPRAVARLSVPCIIGSLVTVLYNLVDTFFVGQLNDPVQNAAVTLVAPIMLSFIAVSNLFGVGTSSLMSRSLGEKDYNTVKRASVFGFYMGIFFAVLIAMGCSLFKGPILSMLGADEATYITSAGYLFWTVSVGCVPSIMNMIFSFLIRSEGSALAASLGTMSGCILNIILDPVFIMPWGLDMGARGAGMATCISNISACIFFFGYIITHRGRTFVNINPRYFGLNKRIAKGIFAVGIPSAIQNLLNVTGMTVFTSFVSAYGADALAAMGIAQKINQIPMQIALGSASGVMPLYSYNYASGDHRRMKKAFYFTFGVILGVIILLSAVCVVASDGIVYLFIKNDNVIAYGSVFLKGFALALPFLIVDFLGVGFFQALGNGKMALIFAISRKIVLEIPALIVLNHIKPPYSLAFAQLCAESILAVASIIVVANIFKRTLKNTYPRM